MGERKMADRPAAMPISMRSRRSRSPRPTSDEYIDAMPEAMSATGPSRPAAPPEPMVMAEATALMGATRARSAPPARWNARTAASVPCPSASGA